MKRFISNPKYLLYSFIWGISMSITLKHWKSFHSLFHPQETDFNYKARKNNEKHDKADDLELTIEFGISETTELAKEIEAKQLIKSVCKSSSQSSFQILFAIKTKSIFSFCYQIKSVINQISNLSNQISLYNQQVIIAIRKAIEQIMIKNLNLK